MLFHEGLKQKQHPNGSIRGGLQMGNQICSKLPQRMPSLGIKTAFTCVALLAMGSLVMHHNLYSLNDHIRNIRTLHHDFSASQATTAKGTSSSFKVAYYQFPSVQQRLKYYMGDWYNNPNWTVPDSDCALLRKENDFQKVWHDVMFRTADIKECMHSHRKKVKAIYCRDSYEMIKNNLHEADSKNNRWIFSYGDRTSGMKATLPVITKARRSALSLAPQPIVWLLNKDRHYNDLEDYHRKIVKQGKEVPWSEKLAKVFWRGSTTYNKHTSISRIDHLAQWINYDDNHTDTDIAFSKVVQDGNDFQHEYVKSQYIREKQSLLEMSRYKYLLSVEGNDVATGLKWMLYSNSVVFMSRPTVATWAMEDLLVPFVHYIPLANDYSNLLEMIKWAKEHDEACQEISKRATEFIKHLWISEQAQKDTEYLQKALVTSYVNQFDDALSKCAPSDKKKRVNPSESNT